MATTEAEDITQQKSHSANDKSDERRCGDMKREKSAIQLYIDSLCLEDDVYAVSDNPKDKFIGSKFIGSLGSSFRSNSEEVE